MKIADDGTIQLPPEVLAQHDLKPGMDLVVVSKGGALRLERADVQARFAALKQTAPWNDVLASADAPIGDADAFIRDARGR
ncbi:MAG: hypothetical protein ACFB20_03255 [Opitutales bacterium]